MVLLSRFERLTDRQQQRLFDALEGEDHAGEVAAVYYARDTTRPRQTKRK